MRRNMTIAIPGLPYTVDELERDNPHNSWVHDEEDEGICVACNGSGEGQHDGTTCSSCKGSGVDRAPVERDDEPDFDEPEEYIGED